MERIYELDLVVYPRRIWVAVGCPTKVLNDYFESKYEEMEPDEEASVSHNRRLCPEPVGGLLVRFKNRKAVTVGNIAHEATHAALGVFDYIGAKADPNNQEPFCYLTGRIAEFINDVKKMRL